MSQTPHNQPCIQTVYLHLPPFLSLFNTLFRNHNCKHFFSTIFKYLLLCNLYTLMYFWIYENDAKEFESYHLHFTLISPPLWSNFRYPFFFTFSYTVGLPWISCQISIYYEHYNARFLDIYFREFSAAINFPCFNSWLEIGVNDVISQKYRTNWNYN